MSLIMRSTAKSGSPFNANGQVDQRDFRFDRPTAVITGGAGLLGVKHAEAIALAGATPVLVDIAGDAAKERARRIGAAARSGGAGFGM